MFFIYSIQLNDLTVDIHDYCKDSAGIEDCLDRTAREFIKREQGERAAESPYRDDTPDSEITDDGYFLRKNADNPNQIDVFHRKTKVQSGYVYNSYDVEIKKVCQFSVSESNIEFDKPVFITETPVTLPPPPPPMPQIPYFDDLKSRLAIQREKIEMTLNDSDSDSDSDTDFECDEASSLLSKLRRKAQLTIDIPQTKGTNLTLAYKPDTMDPPNLDFSDCPNSIFNPVNYHPLVNTVITGAPNVTPVMNEGFRGSFQSPIDFSNVEWGEQTKAVNYPFNSRNYESFGSEEFPF